MKYLSHKKLFFILGFLPILFFILGFLRFVQTIPKNIYDLTTKTDAIIVLTGGANRIALGYELLQKGLAKKLFISGVYNKTRMQDIHPDFSLKTKLQQCCIELGYQAVSTHENAIEVKNWLDQQKYNSFRLVTTDYHIRRSLIEIKHLLPDHFIIPHPVIKSRKFYQGWWRQPKLASFLFKEYIKYLFTKIRVNIS